MDGVFVDAELEYDGARLWYDGCGLRDFISRSASNAGSSFFP